MITTPISVKDEIDGLTTEGSIVWDFENLPHLFPLFLFLHYKDKYCQGSTLETLLVNNFYDFNYAFCRCTVTDLSPEYSLWLQIGKIWETATTLTFLIGHKDFIPFKNRERENAAISLKVLTYGNADTDVVSHCCMHDGCDFKVLQRCKEISDEIQEEMKKVNLKFQAKVR